MEIGLTVRLMDEEFRHLRVLRPRAGELIELVDGQGQLAIAEVVQLAKNEALMLVREVIQQDSPKCEIILVQAIPRINRLDTILEKTTELGVTQIWLFPGDQGEREKVSAQQEQRMRHVVVAAMKQCGRLWMPKIELRPPLLKWTELPEQSYFGDIEPEAPLLMNAWKPVQHEIAFLIGPEAGFSNAEVSHMRQLGAKGVSLHQNILRTDTAPIVALSVISQLMDNGRKMDV